MTPRDKSREKYESHSLENSEPHIQRKFKALYRNIACQMRLARENEGIGQAELFIRSGVTSSTISKIENGSGEGLRLLTLVKMADALGHEIFVTVAPKKEK